MSLSKLAGAASGAIFGLVIAALYAHSVLGHTAAGHHVAAFAASLMLGLLLGAAVGAYIGSEDRRL